MATIQCTISIESYDVDGVPAPVDLYYTVDDAQTLAQAVTEVNALAALLNPLMANALPRAHFTLNFDTGITRAPRTGAQSELTALQSFSIVGVPSRSYGVDIPGALGSKFINGVIPSTDTDQIAWLGGFLVPPTGWVADDNFYQELNSEVSLQTKTFRKKRKSLKQKSHARSHG